MAYMRLSRVRPGFATEFSAVGGERIGTGRLISVLLSVMCICMVLPALEPCPPEHRQLVVVVGISLIPLPLHADVAVPQAGRAVGRKRRRCEEESGQGAGENAAPIQEPLSQISDLPVYSFSSGFEKSTRCNPNFSQLRNGIGGGAQR